MSVSWVEPDWPAPGGVRALSTLRGGGVERRALCLAQLGRPCRRCSRRRGREPAALGGGGRIAGRAGLAAPGARQQRRRSRCAAAMRPRCRTRTADAAFTRRRGRVCAILTADCLPVLLAADSGDWVAAAHAGWRGLAAGVIEATVSALSAAAGAGALPRTTAGVAGSRHRTPALRGGRRGSRCAVGRGCRGGARGRGGCLRAERSRAVHG